MADSVKTIVVQLIIAAILFILETLIEIYILVSTVFERQMTNTDVELSAIYKMSLLKFLTTWLVPLLGHTDHSKWFASSGLIQEMILVVILLFVCENFRITFNIEYLLHLALRTIEKCKGQNSEITQMQANWLWENEEAVFNKTLSIIIVFWFTIMFYLPIIPGLSIIGIIGSIWFYWILKIVILRRIAIKKSINAKMLINSANILRLVPLANGIMALLFFKYAFGKISIPAIIAVAASSLFFLVPIQKKLSTMFVKQAERSDSDTYYDHWKTFKHYDLLNPVTKYAGESRLEGKSLNYAIRMWLIKKLSVIFLIH